jgi:hypothetical protein
MRSLEGKGISQIMRTVAAAADPKLEMTMGERIWMFFQ